MEKDEQKVSVPISGSTEMRSEEDALFFRYARTQDAALRDRLVVSHQGLVRYLAGKFASRGEPVEDLIQVATIGLIKAIDRYEPGRGLKFATYATPTIVGEIQRYFRDKCWRMKVPRRLQELNQSAAKARETLPAKLGRPPTVQEVARAIGATEEETLEAIELSNAYDTLSLDSNSLADDDLTLAEFVGADDERLKSLLAHADLDQALRALDARERAIIVYYYFNDMSQAEIAKRLCISQMHVSRLQKAALQRLRMSLDAAQL